MADPEMKIVRAGGERLDDLQPLWESLHHQHAAAAPHLQVLGEERTPADSWAVRRDLYAGIFAEPAAFVLLAEVDARPVGYALVHFRGPEETWASGDPIAELESLAVLPGHRGQGIGTALVEAVYEELRQIGVAQIEIDVIAGNAEALRFYERLDLHPFMVSLIGNVPPADAQQSSTKTL